MSTDDITGIPTANASRVFPSASSHAMPPPVSCFLRARAAACFAAACFAAACVLLSACCCLFAAACVLVSACWFLLAAACVLLPISCVLRWPLAAGCHFSWSAWFCTLRRCSARRPGQVNSARRNRGVAAMRREGAIPFLIPVLPVAMLVATHGPQLSFGHTEGPHLGHSSALLGGRCTVWQLIVLWV